MNAQRKAIIGEDHEFVWRSPGPLTTTPTLTLVRPDGTSSSDVLLPVAGPAVPSAVASDRRTITINSTTPTKACTGPGFGAVAIVGQDSGYAVAQVERFASATQIVLSEPLPHPITIDGSPSIQWLTYSGTVDAADVGATVQRNVAWSVAYTRRMQGLGIESAGVDRGVMHVVRVPFSTGLRDVDLRALVPGAVVPGRQDSHAPQIDMAAELLEHLVRVRLDAGVYPDQLAGAQFRLAHAYLAAHIIAQGRPAAVGVEPGEGMYQMAVDIIDAVLRRPEWVDLDDDGVVDAGEVDQAQPGTAPTATGTYTAAFEAARTYLDPDGGR